MTRKEYGNHKAIDEESVGPHRLDKYSDGTAYSIRGLIRHQNSGLCARNQSNSQEGNLLLRKNR